MLCKLYIDVTQHLHSAHCILSHHLQHLDQRLLRPGAARVDSAIVEGEKQTHDSSSFSVRPELLKTATCLRKAWPSLTSMSPPPRIANCSSSRRRAGRSRPSQRRSTHPGDRQGQLVKARTLEPLPGLGQLLHLNLSNSPMTSSPA
eukprot:763086-Hanusia_phi.AAC.1